MSLNSYVDLNILDENQAGGDYIAVVAVADVEGFPVIHDSYALDEVQLRTGAQWIPLDLFRFSLDLDIRKASRSGAENFRHTIEAVIPKNRSQVLAALKSYDDTDCLVVYGSLNGDQRLLGTPDNPVRFSWRSVYGQSPERSNQYELSIPWDAAEEAPFYNADLDLANCGPVTILLDGDFYITVPPGTTVDIPFNTIYKEYFTIDNPSGMNKLVNDFQPIAINRELRIDSITDISPEIELLEYSLNDVDYFDLQAAIPLTIPGGNTLYHRATIAEGTTFAQWKENGIYEP